MMEDEAQAIAEVLKTADGGCDCCVGGLADEMKKRFPQFDWYALTGTKNYDLEDGLKEQ